MGRKGITLEQVQEAITVLQAAGQRVTSRTVREYLGTGSMSTINMLMRQIRALSAPEVKNVGFDRPVDIPALDRDLRALRAMYADNQRQAGQIIELQRQLAYLQSEAQENARLRTRLDFALARIEELKIELATYQRRPKRKPHETPTPAELETAGQTRLVD